MLIAQETATITGTLAFEESVPMTFDPSAMAQQIRNLIRMYSNPRLAALREYTSNARDSHKAAGYQGPVEVTLPTALHPFLTIKDYGLGLTREEIKGFGQFGRSTKAGSNEYIGGFGLGSKSGLAVATQFTVIAVKDGVMNTAIVGRDEHNMPSLGFMAEQPTNEPNGVTIKIPSATDHNDWVGIANGNTFIGWEPGSIVVNGKAPAVSVHDDTLFTRLAGGWLIKEREKGYSYGGFHIKALVHGVFYNIPSERFNRGSVARVLRGSVLEIENGSVDILPSRDDLEWTPRTIAAVNAASDVLVRSIVAEYQKQITTVKTFREAKQIVTQMEQIDLPTSGLTWNGIELDWSRGADLNLTIGTAKYSATAKSGYQTERVVKTLRASQDTHRQHSVLVLGCTGESKSGYYKRDMKYVLESSETTPFVIAEATAEGKDVSDVVVYFHTETSTKGMHDGFVASFAKIINLPDFAAQAVAQRKEWAKNRTITPAGQKPAGPVFRNLRTIRGMESFNNSFTTFEQKEADLAQNPDGFVLIHADDALAAQVLEGHVSGQYNQKIKTLMSLIGQKANKGSGVQFVLLPRNQKAANLAATNWVTLTDWVKSTLAQVVVRTPMQIAAEQYAAKRSYYARVPKDFTPAHVAQIKDAKMREWMNAYINPIQDGVVGEVSTHFPEYAVTQPAAEVYDVEGLYPLLPMVASNMGRTGQQAVIDYINMADDAR